MKSLYDTSPLPGCYPKSSRSAGWLLGAAELTILTVTIGAFGALLVPSHWTSLWGDREFTGWVAPLSNRLGQGLVLYADGGHLPMPPLPFVLVHDLTGGHATWRSESLIHFVFQVLLIGTLYLWLSVQLPRPWPFLTTFATLPVYFALPKTISYDSMTQFLVALLAVLLNAYVAAWVPRFLPTWLYRAAVFLALVVTASLVILCKQSTGVGALIGVCAVLLIFGRDERPLWRLGSAAVATLLIGCLVLLLAAAMAPYVDFRGFIADVFWTGSEPKGGVTHLLRNSAIYAGQVAGYGAAFLIFLLAVRSALGPQEKEQVPLPMWSDLPLGYGMAALAVVLLALIGLVSGETATVVFTPLLPLTELLLWGGLLAFLAQPIVKRALGGDALPLPRPLRVLFVALFPAAWFHSFSVDRFRWTYDNNPLIAIALAGLLLLAARGAKGIRQRRPRTGLLMLGLTILAVNFLAWTSFLPQYAACRRCTETWDEIAYLRGARLPPAASGMRQVVAEVRRLAPDAEADEVLLLPDDPNVESWFERRRPALQGAIIFADQYWDRYVDADFARLSEQPPKVIVLGPRHSWRSVSRQWNVDRGCERLIDRVRNELLPQRYERAASQEINYSGKHDYVDIYARK